MFRLIGFFSALAGVLTLGMIALIMFPHEDDGITLPGHV